MFGHHWTCFDEHQIYIPLFASFLKTAKYNNPSSSCSCPTPREPCLFPCCRWLFRFSFSIHVFIFSLHRALLLNTCFHLITSSASFLDHFDEKRFSLNTIFMFSLRQHLSLTILINTIPTAWLRLRCFPLSSYCSATCSTTLSTKEVAHDERWWWHYLKPLSIQCLHNSL